MGKALSLGTGLKAGWGILKIIRLSLFAIFFVFLMISIVTSAIKNKDAGIVVKELGEEFYSPISSAQNLALEIQQKEVGGLLSYWELYYHLYKIYLWLWVLMIPINWLFKDNNPPLIRFGMAIAIFLTIQFVYLTVHEGNANALFVALRDIWNGLSYIFTNTNFKDGAEGLLGANNTCSGEVCTI